MHPENSLSGKAALITGAGSGIGKAAAKFLALAGARVAALSRTSAEVETTADEIRKAGGAAIACAADVSSPEQMQSALAQIEQSFGRLDIVVANAGINGVWASLEELRVEDWDQILDINLKGTFLTIKYTLPLLKRQGGSIIITSSVNGTRMFSNTGASAYATSKAGQVAFGKMIALELARDKIRVNIICPGWIQTKIADSTKRSHLEGLRPRVLYPDGIVPLKNGQPGSPEEVAQLIWFLASDLSSHITGTEIFIDGGESLLEG